MATTTYGVNYTKYRASLAGTAGGTVIDASYGWGNAAQRYDEYTTNGLETTGSLIYMGILRPRERAMGGLIAFPVIVTAGTVIVGDGGYTAANALDEATAVNADTDRYLASTVVSSASTATGVELCAQAGLGFKNNSKIDLPVYLTTGGATYAGSKLIQVLMRIGTITD